MENPYLAGRRAAMEKLAYDWLGDSGLSLGGLSEYRSTADLNRVTSLKSRIRKIKEYSAAEKANFQSRIPGLPHYRIPDEDTIPAYTGRDELRKAIAALGRDGSVADGLEYIYANARSDPAHRWSGSELDMSYDAREKARAVDQAKFIGQMKDLSYKSYFGAKDGDISDLFDLAPQQAIVPLLHRMHKQLRDDPNLYDRNEEPLHKYDMDEAAASVDIPRLAGDLKNKLEKNLALKNKYKSEMDAELSKRKKTYLTPQNINRLAILGGTAGGAYLGDFTPRAFGVSLGGAITGNLLGGAAGAGINAFRGGERSNLVPLIGSTAGALGGGLAAGKYLS